MAHVWLMLMKRLMNKKALVVAGAVVGLLLAVQIATYCWYARSAVPLVLARCVWPGGGDFVVVDAKIWNELTDSQKRFLSGKLPARCRIYHSVEEVPDSGKVWIPITQEERDAYERVKQRQSGSPGTMEAWRREIESGRRLAGFSNGIQVGWRLEASGLFWMRCAWWNWMSREGSEQRSDAYVWILGRWVRVKKVFHVMA